MKKKLVPILLTAMIITVFPITAQTSEEDVSDDYIGKSAYSTGEQVFNINAGAIFPLFTIAPFASEGTSAINPDIGETSIGLTGSLEFGAFVMDNLMLGGELSGMFAATPNRVLTMVPISFTAAYYFMFYPIEVPVHLNIGMSFNTLGDYFTMTPVIKPGIGALWNINDEWAIGLNAEYWFIPEIYYSDEFKDQSRIANFLELGISGSYHF